MMYMPAVDGVALAAAAMPWLVELAATENVRLRNPGFPSIWQELPKYHAHAPHRCRLRGPVLATDDRVRVDGGLRAAVQR
jgi:hypothetical protein